jgi:hypothetical protein
VGDDEIDRALRILGDVFAELAGQGLADGRD